MDDNISESSSQHLAPEESPEHLALRAAARKAGQDEETLRDLLWLINAHDRLLGLRQIAANLLKILEPKLTNKPTKEDHLALFRGWPQVLQWIVDTSRDTGRPGDPCPIRGKGLTRNPLYACLWYVSEESRWKRKYRQLQWHLLWAHVSYLFKTSSADSSVNRSAYEAYSGEVIWDAFPNSPYLAALAVWEMAKSGWGELLRVLPLAESPEVFAQKLNKVKVPEISEQLHTDSHWRKRPKDLQLFLSKANGLQDWDKRQGGPKGASTRYQERILSSADTKLGDEDDPDARWPKARWVTISSPVAKIKRETLLEEYDLDPDEVNSPEHRFQVESESLDHDPQQLAVQSALAARGQRRHVELAHQLLPWQYNQFTLQELAWLLTRTHKELNELSELTEWTEDQYHIAKLVTLIHVMLWTGSTLERAWNLRMLTEEDTKEIREERIDDTDLLFEIDKHQWRLHPPSPPYKSEILSKHAHSLAITFCLPDIARTGVFLGKLLDRRLDYHVAPSDDPESPAGRLKRGYLFEKGLEHYREDLRKWLHDRAYEIRINNLTGRLTVGRITSFLFNRLLAVTSDLMAAVLITGHTLAQARTQRFYGTYSVAELQEIYVKATSTIVHQAYNSAKLPVPEPVPPASVDKESYVGARLCAKHASVKEAVQRIRVRIGELSQNRSLSESIDFHNFYTLHTVLLFAYATSIRAIWIPYKFPEEVDEVTGFTFISDKDDDAQHKTRLAWVPPLVMRQMRSYADHLFAVALNNQHASNCLAAKPCFFLDATGKTIDVGPKTISERMEPFLALPPNAHRRFMRHELLGRGCPPEIVNAWMGHAFQGEEPWGPHSSFSFAEYRNTLEPCLNSALEELGWEYLKSPLT